MWPDVKLLVPLVVIIITIIIKDSVLENMEKKTTGTG